MSTLTLASAVEALDETGLLVEAKKRMDKICEKYSGAPMTEGTFPSMTCELNELLEWVRSVFPGRKLEYVGELTHRAIGYDYKITLQEQP